MLLYMTDAPAAQFISRARVKLVVSSLRKRSLAFLWVESASAAPQTLWITLLTITVRYRLSLLPSAARFQRHTRFSSADVLYLIMTDRFAQAPRPTSAQ